MELAKLLIMLLLVLFLSSCANNKQVMIGFKGTELSNQTVDLIEKHNINYVILHIDNIESKEQLKTLTSHLKKLGVENIAVDQEGDINSAVKLINDFASLRYLLTLPKEEVYSLVYNQSKELLELGITMNLGPVLDIDNSTFIAERSLSADALEVVEYGRVIIKAMKHAGIKICAKHFPGHGDTFTDSHYSLPVKNQTLEEIKNNELLPFKMAVEEGVECIMIGHLHYPNIDKDNPATISYFFITDLLRKELGFKGVIMSDDFEMRAISNNSNFKENIIKAFDAGTDVVIVPHTYEKQVIALEVARQI